MNPVGFHIGVYLSNGNTIYIYIYYSVGWSLFQLLLECCAKGNNSWESAQYRIELLYNMKNKYINVLHIYLFGDKRTRWPVGFMRGNHQACGVPNARKNRKIQKISEISNRHRMFMIGWSDVRMYMTAFWMHVGVCGQREYYVCVVTVHTHNTLFWVCNVWSMLTCERLYSLLYMCVSVCIFFSLSWCHCRIG